MSKKIEVTEKKGGYFYRLYESMFGAPKETPLKNTSVAVLGMVEQSIGVYQLPSFRDQVTCLWNDPLLKEAVTMFAEQVLATGTFLTFNGKYEFEINGKRAIDIIVEWCDANHIDLKLLEMIIELKAFGNSFWRLAGDLGFVKIPIEAVWHATKVADNIPLQEKYNVQLMPIYGALTIPWGQFVHFRVGVTGYHAPFGQGVIHSLLATPISSDGRVAPSIYDIRLNMRASLDEGFKKFSFGNEVWSFEEMSDEAFQAKDPVTGYSLSDRISKMKSTGNRIATNVKAHIDIAVPERTQSYDMFIKQMNDEFFMALADPSLKMGLEQGFTKATSVTASETYKYKVSTMRKSLKQNFEDLFVQILDKMGYDGHEAKVEMNFGPEETAEYNIADIFAANDRKIICINEARYLLSKYHKWDITGDIKGGDKEDVEKQLKIDLDASKRQAVVGTAKQGTSGKPMSIPLQATQTPEQISKKMDEAKRLKEDIRAAALQMEGPPPQAPQTVIVRQELADSIAHFNADFSIIYVDPLVEDWQMPLIIAHENFFYQMLKLGKTRPEAERLATKYEETVAKSLGIDWEKAQKKYLEELASVEKRGSKNPSDVA